MRLQDEEEEALRSMLAAVEISLPQIPFGRAGTTPALLRRFDTKTNCILFLEESLRLLTPHPVSVCSAFALKGVKKTGGRFGSLDYPSPVMVGDRLFYMNGSGQMYVFRVSDKLEQMAVNEVTSEKEIFWGSPAVSDGKMVIRSQKHLYCIADKG